jgi:hypothetical protein
LVKVVRITMRSLDAQLTMSASGTPPAG